MPEPTKLQFRVSSAIKSVIGRDLITNDFVAIFELVKNSFDAGASKVDIVFHTSKDNKNKLFVIDNGKGMDLEDIENKWLFVAYSAKKDHTEDEGETKKAYAGNKGIGRFSCDRLGQKLKLQAKKEKTDQVEVLNVDWGNFEKSAKTLFESINILHSTTKEMILPMEAEKVVDHSHGVIIEVDLWNKWDRKKLLKLKQHLAKLINPFGDSSSSFEVVLHCNDEKKGDDKILSGNRENREQLVVNGTVENLIFESLKNKTTSLNVYIQRDNTESDKGHIISELVDRGEIIYKIREEASDFMELLDAEFNCQIYYLNRSAKITFNKRMGVSGPEFGSIFLFRNGFRVYPVGETDDDYWKMATRKSQGYNRYLGSREVMGRVDIAGDESKFKEASSRDKGLVDTLASEQLFKVVTKCIRRLENYVVGVTWKDKLDKEHDTAQRLSLDENRTRIIDLVLSLSSAKNIELLEYNDNLVNILSEKSEYFESTLNKLSNFAKDSTNEKLQEGINAAIVRFDELKKAEQEALKRVTEEEKARVEAEKKALAEEEKRKKAEKKSEELGEAYKEEKKRNLFLMGSGSRDKDQLESFHHQIIIYAADNKERIATRIKRIHKNNDFDVNELLDLLGDLLETTEKIITTSRFATFANFRLDSAHVDDDICLHIKEYIEKISAAYQSRISVAVDTDNIQFKVSFTPIELGMVLDNLVNNAKKSRASNIKFSFQLIAKDILQINIIDNGNGLKKSLTEPERIFEKGFTTTKGSGLGLYHSRKQIEKFGGELILAKPQPNIGAEFIIRIKK